MFLYVYRRVLDVAFRGRNSMTLLLDRQAIMCTRLEHTTLPILLDSYVDDSL